MLQTDWSFFKIKCSFTASTSANIASSVRDTTWQDIEEYEQEEDGEVDMDNYVMVRHVFIMERLALMTYSFVLCSRVVHCCGAVVYSMGVYVHHHWGLPAVRVLYVRQKLRTPPPPPRAAGGWKCQGRVLFPVRHWLRVNAAIEEPPTHLTSSVQDEEEEEEEAVLTGIISRCLITMRFIML